MMNYSYLSRILGGALLWILILFSFLSFFSFAEAVNILNYKDTLSTSAPTLYSDHVIEFRNTQAIPASGFITITPEATFFNIPMSTFAIRNVELYVSTSSGYVLRLAESSPDATSDGISITTGTSGNVTITLNSTTGIPANADLRILLGNNTTNATGTDTGFQNPAVTGTREIGIAYGGGASGNAGVLVAIVDQVGVGPIDTTETIPPFRFNGAPSGELSGVVTSAEVSLETNEFSVCRYDTASGTPYASMTFQFNSTSSIFHSFIATGLLNNTTYTYYVRCIDDEDNFNIDDYIISFSIPEELAGDPGGGDGGGDEGGTGEGDDGTGSGSGSGDTGGSGSGGGGSGGGDGGGGFESGNDPFESGDGLVIINGFAFPRADITVLVDGAIAETANANSQGDFSVTIDEIARGVYTFGVYATDQNGVKSSTFTTTFSIIGARGSTLSNVNLMPTISITPERVEPGETVTFSGFGIANSAIFIETQQDVSGSSITNLTTTSAADGSWSVSLNTTGFAIDTWKVRGRSTQVSGSISTGWSEYFFYGVGVDAGPSGLDADLNRDGFVNLIDFSILLFHWGTDGGTSNPPADINHDGRVSLSDFSIMLFQWTG